jgi:hypothetical protein
MADDQVDLLKGIAEQFRKLVRETNLFDANVCTSPVNPERPWEHLELPGDIFRQKVDILCKGHEVTLRANGEFVVTEVLGDFDVDVCSINRRDRVFQLEYSFSRIPGFPSLPIFSRQSANIRQLLNSTALQRALEALQLKSNESVHIYRNGIFLYLQRRSQDDVMSAVEVACNLAGELPTSRDKGFDLDTLPARFKGLSDLIRKWAMSDDEARSELIEQASHKTLERFVAAVTPHISAIAGHTALLRQVKGVGPITSLAYVLTLENPERFATSRDVGP